MFIRLKKKDINFKHEPIVFNIPISFDGESVAVGQAQQLSLMTQSSGSGAGISDVTLTYSVFNTVNTRFNFEIELTGYAGSEVYEQYLIDENLTVDTIIVDAEGNTIAQCFGVAPDHKWIDSSVSIIEYTFTPNKPISTGEYKAVFTINANEQAIEAGDADIIFTDAPVINEIYIEDYRYKLPIADQFNVIVDLESSFFDIEDMTIYLCSSLDDAVVAETIERGYKYLGSKSATLIFTLRALEENVSLSPWNF